MKVSVLIRAFNRADLVREAINSALEQTYKNLEILVVDDGSTDSTADVLRLFRDHRIRTLKHDSNRGVGAACNTGIRAATGELVAWLDSDDVWHPNKVQQQVDFLRQYREVDGVFSDVRIRHLDRNVPSLIEHMKAFQKYLHGKPRGTEFVVSQREMYLCLLQEVPIKPTALMLRRSVFGQVGLFDENARSGEDWEFLLRLARHASFGYIDRPLAEINRTVDSTFDRFRLDDKTFLIAVFKRERELLRQDAEAFNTARRGLVYLFKTLGYGYIESGQLVKAAKVYLDAYQATRDAKMILQAGAAFLPVNFRRALLRRLRTASLS
jgi:glycosyltransferase involved in cell wall biosynthesis